MGRLNDAEKCYQQCLNFYRKRNDRWEAISWHKLGNVALLRKNYTGATEHYRKALAIYDKLNNKENEEAKANTIGQLATVAASQAKDALNNQETEIAKCYYAEAEKLYQEVLAIYDRVDNQAKRAITFGNLGNVTMFINNDRAEQYYQNALQIEKGRKDSHGIARTYAQLAFLYSKRNYDQNALAYYIRAAKIFRELRARERQINLQNAALLFLRVGEKGLEELCKAVAAEPDVGPAEVETFLEELTAFSRQLSGTD